MLIDFKILKEHTNTILDTLDHTYLNELPIFAGKSPSSELIAEYIFVELEKKLAELPVKVKKIVAWESEKAAASYFR